MATTLKIDRGTTYTITVEYTRGGVAQTLVGATVRFTMKATEFSADMTDTDALVQYDITDGTAEGVAVIELVPADTADLAPGNYYYDIKVEDADGNVYKLDEGRVKLDGSPTNRLTP